MVFYCCVCNRELYREFIYYCRPCYRSYMHLLRISNDDFINYVNRSFKCNLTLSNTDNSCKFIEIYNVLKLKYNLLNLDRILENILYIKMITNTTKFFRSIKPKQRKYIQHIH
jgi:hypothetical protein